MVIFHKGAAEVPDRRSATLLLERRASSRMHKDTNSLNLRIVLSGNRNRFSGRCARVQWWSFARRRSWELISSAAEPRLSTNLDTDV